MTNRFRIASLVGIYCVSSELIVSLPQGILLGGMGWVGVWGGASGEAFLARIIGKSVLFLPDGTEITKIG